jgi:hypothetical protein
VVAGGGVELSPAHPDIEAATVVIRAAKKNARASPARSNLIRPGVNRATMLLKN